MHPLLLLAHASGGHVTPGNAVAESCEALQPFRPLRTRNSLGDELARLGMSGNAVELGVQQGRFSRQLLTRWKNCSTYVQVDLWQQQSNYADIANVPDDVQGAYRAESEQVLHTAVKHGHAQRGVQCANLTSVCAQRFDDGYFDFVYLDARHDRLGVLQDLAIWWPKARRGALVCGHDYTEQSEPSDERELDPQQTGQDWTLNFDGTRDESGRVVKGAVDDFFDGIAPPPYGSPPELQRCPRQVVVTYREAHFNTWCVRK